jgi:3-(3-hydroxy-phenyl)propionate hydroxylase
MTASNTTRDQAAEHDVLVVGAGPVGLTAALALRARGLRPVVLEAGEEGRQRPGSRALFVHKASLKTLERVSPGLSHRIVDDGMIWSTKRTFWRGRQVYARTYPPSASTGLPAATSLPQVTTERHMLAACRAAGVDFAWGQEVEQVTTDAGGATLVTAAGRSWRARYVVAADGARSASRESVGITRSGTRSANSFVVVDVADDPDTPLPAERVFHYAHPAVGGRNVLLVPFAGGWRVDLQCRVGDDPEAFGGASGVRDWLAQVMPSAYVERVTWVSTYQFLQVVADTFADQHGRVLLVGEAAHLFAPFGARGMNSGIADADAAAAALADAVSADGSTARAAVERFANERRVAAEYNRDAAGTALAHMEPKRAGVKLKLHAAALLAPRWRRAGAWLDAAPYGPRSGPPGATNTKY